VFRSFKDHFLKHGLKLGVSLTHAIWSAATRFCTLEQANGKSD
jgi:hypothetical protein